MQLSGRRQARPRFCLFTFPPTQKTPFPHSENHSKDRELRGAWSIFCVLAPDMGVVLPALVPRRYDLLLEKEWFLWTKVVFQKIITLHLERWDFGDEISFGKCE